jgi:transposase InsO family protein
MDRSLQGKPWTPGHNSSAWDCISPSQASRCKTPTSKAPTQSGFQDECLNEHWSSSITEVKAIVEAWRQDYNTVRPHSSLGYRTPEQVVREDMILAVGLA